MRREPALFVGHGSPMIALESTPASVHLHTLITHRPRAILVISAHWVHPTSALSIHSSSDLIYDFYGFPPALYRIKYPAPSAPEMIPIIHQALGPIPIIERGLDHGAWSVLLHLASAADIPILQLSLCASASLEEHYRIASAIQPLRDQGIMILGSGNLTHNLRLLDRAREAPIQGWAHEVDEALHRALATHDIPLLLDPHRHIPDFGHAHPTLEHYLPLLYIAGVRHREDRSSFPYRGFEYGSLSMGSWLLES